MIIKTILKPGETGYVVNLAILSGNRLEYERFNGYSKLEEAQIIAKSLANNESKTFNSDNLLYVNVEKVECDEDGDFNYTELKQYSKGSMIDTELMLNEDFFELTIKQKFPFIHSFSIEEDHNSDGTPINICWLKLGYVSPSSNCGFFHFTSIDQMLIELDLIEIYRNCESEEQEEYMFWLASNTCLFMTRDPEERIEKIAKMCFQQRKGDIL